MRVEAYSQIHQLYQSPKMGYTQQAAAAKVGQTDKLQISNLGRDIQIAKAALAGTPDVREDVVLPIKEKIDNGSYQVDTISFAEKLLQRYEEMR